MTEDRLERLFWWDDSQPRSPHRVAAQVMVFGNLDDIREAGQRFGSEIFGEVLDHPPRGLFDKKSWCFWHKKLGRPLLPLPPQLVPWPTA
jgi:hypothetical protein